MRVFFKTFGCRSNLFDTQVMMANLKGYEIVSDENLADIIVVNSCTVTNGADSGVQGYINRFRDSKKRIYFTGCGAGSKGKENYEKNLAFGVFPHSLKEDISALLQKEQRFFYAEEQPLHIDSTIVSEFVGKTRAFIKIEEGCDFACSYCIIPSVRGGARSFPKAKIIKQVRQLLDSGVSEIILTGTNVGSYGKDLENESIASLIESLFKLDGLKRLRVGSLEPSQISEEFLNLTQENLFEKHLHIALQHTHNTMLEIMNRQNRVEQDLELFTRLHKQGFFLGTDFIVAHPGESEEIWEQTLENFKHFPITHLHPFIYSPRAGTPSASMKNTTKGDVAKQRLHTLKSIVQENNYQMRCHCTKPLNVLIESVTTSDIIESRQSLDFKKGGVWVPRFNDGGASGDSHTSYLCHGLDEFFNKITIESAQPLQSGQWLEIAQYQANKEGNYAKI
ncbi:tRNA (N(6)-L-threonylcarbamoyladenosine(37)-C(2))-methylthiotransferase MtaB [uncultured Helicobacter sp.]|uniref:tRNA (N(6)-L-threonylcarbamoyladenosine(37)-C(2))- methylthiotransferase MtaB n=1 Tax=uncultured Helicobacter sp. TaxID=175537 RepID=UPI00374F9343